MMQTFSKMPNFPSTFMLKLNRHHNWLISPSSLILHRMLSLLPFFYKDARHQTCTGMLSLCVSLKAGAHYLEALNAYTGLAKVGYGFTDMKIIRS